MPIMPKVVSKERREAAARGVLTSAQGSRPAAKKAPPPSPPQQINDDDDSDSATSSDSDDGASSVASSKSRGSNVGASTKKAEAPQTADARTRRSHRDPLEDHAAYCKRTAKAEWLFATGQAGPTPPPPKASPAAAAAAGPHQLAKTSAPASKSADQKQEETPKVAPPKPFEVTSPLTKKIFTVSEPAAVAAVEPAVVVAPVAEKKPQEVAAASKGTRVLPSTVSSAVPEHKDIKAKKEGPVTVTDEEEAANPGRRDFLKLLDLLAHEPAKEDKSMNESDKEQAQVKEVEPQKRKDASAPKTALSFAQLHQQEFDKLYDEWLEDDAVQRPFMALESWEKARTLALIRENGGSFDPSVMHAMYRQQSDLLSQIQSAAQRFEECCTVLEQLVMDRTFVRRVTAFLHKHHRTFLSSKPNRERGEFAHAEYLVYQDYSGMVQQMVLGELAAKVENFDPDEFFDALFDTPASSIVAAAASTSGESGEAAQEQQQVLSFEVWEILLSFLKFENFCDVMDDYIATHYNTNTYDNAVGASKVGGLRGVKRRSPPPASSANTPPLSASSQAARGSTASSTAPQKVASSSAVKAKGKH
jgi:hypothetical protein